MLAGANLCKLLGLVLFKADGALLVGVSDSAFKGKGAPNALRLDVFEFFVRLRLVEEQCLYDQFFHKGDLEVHKIDYKI